MTLTSIRCTFVWDGVRCSRTASNFYSLNESPYYAAFCDRCSHKSNPRGLDNKTNEISESDAVVRSILEGTPYKL